MNRYETYQDSGIPWLGEVPAHWGIMPVKFSLAIPITDGPHETPEILSEGIPFISAEAVKNDKLDFNKKRGYISEEDNARFSKKYSPLKGDIYMVKSGATTGNVAKVETDEVFNIWSPLAVMRPNKNTISTNFLFYAIKSDYFNTSVQLKWNMGTQQNIGMGVLSNIRIFIPPLPEQTAITHYLDNKLGEIDALISKQETLLEKLAEQRTAMITHAVTKGLNAHAPMKNSGVAWLGEVPAHWEVKKLKYLCKIITGYTPSKNNDENYDENGFLWVKPDNLNDFSEIHETKEKISILGVKDGYLIPKGSILVCSIGTIGKMGIAGKDLLTNQQINSFIFNEKVNELFRKYLVYSAKGIFEYMANDNVVRILNANTQKNIFFVVPPLAEQTAITNYLDEQTAKIDRLSDTVHQTIASLKEYRSALITQAVTGKIKVV